GLRPRMTVLSVFVTDGGSADPEEGARLLRLSREFGDESAEFDRSSLDILDVAYEEALRFVSNRRDEELTEAQRLADERASIAEERARRVAAHKHQAAEDRIASC